MATRFVFTDPAEALGWLLTRDDKLNIHDIYERTAHEIDDWTTAWLIFNMDDYDPYLPELVWC